MIFPLPIGGDLLLEPSGIRCPIPEHASLLLDLKIFL
jgi:hypothetical protein